MVYTDTLGPKTWQSSINLFLAPGSIIWCSSLLSNIISAGNKHMTHTDVNQCIYNKAQAVLIQQVSKDEYCVLADKLLLDLRYLTVVQLRGCTCVCVYTQGHVRVLIQVYLMVCIVLHWKPVLNQPSTTQLKGFLDYGSGAKKSRGSVWSPRMSLWSIRLCWGVYMTGSCMVLDF